MRLLTSIILCLLIYSCKKVENKTSINIPIEKRILSNRAFKTTLKSLVLLDSIPDELSNIPKLDSFAILKLNLYKLPQFDTKTSNLKNAVFAVSGYKNNKQIVIVDENNNYDFEDDRIVSTSLDFKHKIEKDINLRDSIPLLNVRIEKNDENGHTYNEIYYLKAFPHYGYYYPIRDSIRENYKLTAQISEYWYGEFNFKNIDYKIGINKFGLFNIPLLITKKHDSFPSIFDINYFPYTTRDTFPIGNDYFFLKHYNSDIKDLTLKKISNDSVYINGYRMGHYLSSITFTDVNTNELTSIDDILVEKKYALLDFWGTWCGPCKEITPDLIALNKKYKNKLNIVSFAYDKKVAPVKSYINEHHMDWYHAFIEGNAKGGKHPKLINNLRVKTYPTLMLIDSKKKIVFRGHSQSIRAIDSILAK